MEEEGVSYLKKFGSHLAGVAERIYKILTHKS
jgi:hypothetical protein